MKQKLTLVQWIFAACLGLFACINGFHWSSIFLVLAGVVMMPLPAIQRELKKRKLKNRFVIFLSVFLALVGILTSPLGKAKPAEPEGSVTTETGKQTEEKTEEETPGHSTGTKPPAASSSVFSPPVSTAPVTTAPLSTAPPSTVPPTTAAMTYPSVGAGKAEPISVAEISPYEGIPYAFLNNNIPNFASSELKSAGYETYGPLDEKGRVTLALASLGRDTMPEEGEKRGDISKIYPTGWEQKQYDNVDGKYLYNRCHLIGWQLSAENANRQNLLTGTRYFNTEGMLPFENLVADYIKETGNHVAYRVTPVFDGTDLLCRGVQLEAYSVEDQGEGISFHVFCYNVQPDILLDYASGESQAQTVTPPPTTTEQTDPSIREEAQEWVWTPTKSKGKYHKSATAHNMVDPERLTKAEAIRRGIEPCGICY